MRWFRQLDCIEGLKTLSNIDLIITDPPYGIDFKSGRQKIGCAAIYGMGGDLKVRDEDYFEKIEGDKELPVRWLKYAFDSLKESGAIYIFCHWKKWAELQSKVISTGFVVKNMIVINKSNHGMGDLKGAYAPKHELVLFATKGRHILNRDPKRLPDVWSLPVKFTGARKLHPNEKPQSWAEPIIANSSHVGDLVVDPFCGSGSFCKQAIKMGRRSFGFDLHNFK